MAITVLVGPFTLKANETEETSQVLSKGLKFEEN